MKLQQPKLVFVSSVWNPDLATIFHDGSTAENCDYKKTDVEYPDWYCPTPKWGYPLALFGMITTSIAKALRLGMPTKLTAQWFEPNEYDIANSLASLAQPLGTMMTFLLAPFIAKEPSDLSYLLSYFAIPVFLSFIGSLFVRQEGYNIKVSEQSFKELVVVLIRTNYVQKRKNVQKLRPKFV